MLENLGKTLTDRLFRLAAQDDVEMKFRLCPFEDMGRVYKAKTKMWSFRYWVDYKRPSNHELEVHNFLQSYH